MTSQYATHVCWDTTFVEDLFGNVADVSRGREFNQEQREKGRRRNPSVKICASCIKNICAVRPDFSSRREKDVAPCDFDLNVNRLWKELFLGGCLHSACGICFSWRWELMAERKCAWTWSWDSLCHALDTKYSFFKVMKEHVLLWKSLWIF